jgi:hypothetical protein
MSYQEIKSQEPREALDINQPGLLFHGTDEYTVPGMRRICTEGLLSSKRQNRIDMRYIHVPDYVSLSLSPRQGYASSSAYHFGANKNAYTPHFTFVIDPKYVQAHVEEFTAVGRCLAPDADEREWYEIDGKFPYELLYEADSESSLFWDEVLTRRIPASALIGIITAEKDRIVLSGLQLHVPLLAKLVTYNVSGEVIS